MSDLSRSIPAGRNTNSNDFKALRCRVFVGNLNTDGTSKTEVEELFSKFGELASCSLHKNFGFVQFVEEKAADEAVTAMHGKTLFGKRIDCNLAGLRRKTQEKDKFERPPDKEVVVPLEMRKFSGKSAREPRRRSRSPLRREGGRATSPMSRYDEFRREDSYGRPDYRRGYPDRYESTYPPPPRDYRDDPYARPYRAPLPVRPAIDCEVVSLSKEESRYAEDVESRLRSIGLVCNIGYPPVELSTVELVDRIARCGTLYAIVVTANNAQHRSCTLNVLHGTRQEHRNMPLDDALSFIARNFDNYLRVLPLKPPAYYPPRPEQYPPRDYRGYPGYDGQAPPPSARPAYRAPEPQGEKNLSTEELSQMIEKLKREKEEREKSEVQNSPPSYKYTSSAQPVSSANDSYPSYTTPSSTSASDTPYGTYYAR